MDCSYRADDLFGPAVQACRRSFDFTLLFEESILSIAPAASFLLLASVRLKTLLGRGRRVRDGHLHTAKLVSRYLEGPHALADSGCTQIATVIYGCLQLVFLVLWCTRSSFSTRTSIPTAAISLAAAFVVCWLSHLEHRRAIRPSPLLSVYLFLTLIFDAARARTLWLADQESVVSALFTATVAVKLVLLGLESTSKRRYLTSKDVQGSPEETSGVFSQTLLLWLFGLLKNGYRKILLPEDLYPTDAAMSSDFLGHEFRKHWESQACSYPTTLILARILALIIPLSFVSYIPQTTEIRLDLGCHQKLKVAIVSACSSQTLFAWLHICATIPCQQSDRVLRGVRTQRQSGRLQSDGCIWACLYRYCGTYLNRSSASHVSRIFLGLKHLVLASCLQSHNHDQRGSHFGRLRQDAGFGPYGYAGVGSCHLDERRYR